MGKTYLKYFVKSFLILNALMYLGFSSYCSFYPAEAAGALGIELLDQKGLVEFITVYGGLEFALCVVFSCGLFKENLTKDVLLFSVVLYGSLVTFRIVALIFTGLENYGGYPYLIAETLFYIVSQYLVLSVTSHDVLAGCKTENSFKNQAEI